ncbi:protein MODIFYING WALL LIGNIN-1-like [Oryza brachyantha]|uniref:protein MODIFYING WALL LIGNIN-1-like n=1 Tax=Oryza brachyantha TaxID=4533 RepID=UPI0007762C7D|nr:protein MODIFYING WALL LIGNIN-1-like [Oryza brachyantha]
MAGKMDKKVIIVSTVVGSLGLLSAILGFSAEGTKITISDIRVVGDECLYPQNAANALAISGAVFLLMAQIAVSAIGGCCGCCKSRSIPSETKRIIGVVCAVVSWIAAGFAWVLFVVGATGNGDGSRATWPDCYVLKDGIFAGAAVLALVATAFGIASYVMLRRQAGEAPGGKPAEQPPLAGIAMGNPHFPPPPPSHGPTAW